MDSYLRGNPVTIVQRFYSVDPVTQVEELGDPTSVVFTVEAPNGSSTAYVFGVDPEITNPSVGLYLLALAPPSPSGIYAWRAEGGGAIVAANEGLFSVLESAVLSPDGASPPVAGPCSSWIDGADIATCGADLGVGSDYWRLNDAAADASLIMWALSGRQFGGVCTTTRRPCASPQCGGWDSWSSGLPYSWAWTLGSFGWGWYGGRDQPRTCGCDPLSTVKLPGWPVRQILQVKIDGVVLPQLDDGGNRNYRLDRYRDLVRMDDPGPPVVKRYWPSCQNLSLDDTEAGTFSVSYEWGMEPPMLGKAAAAAMGRELWLACTGGKCALPSRVTKIVRQGVTIDRVSSVAAMLRQGSSGLPLVDSFIAAVNPSGKTRRTAIYSPDVQPYAKKVG